MESSGLPSSCHLHRYVVCSLKVPDALPGFRRIGPVLALLGLELRQAFAFTLGSSLNIRVDSGRGGPGWSEDLKVLA